MALLALPRVCILSQTFRLKRRRAFSEVFLHWIGLSSVKNGSIIDIKCIRMVNTKHSDEQFSKKKLRIVCIGKQLHSSVESFWQEGKMQSGSKWIVIFFLPVSFQVTDALSQFSCQFNLIMITVLRYKLLSCIYIAFGKYFFRYGDAMYIRLNGNYFI
jgi:hypothetical protein